MFTQEYFVMKYIKRDLRAKQEILRSLRSLSVNRREPF